MESLWNGFERRPNDPVLFARLRDALDKDKDFAGLAKLYRRRADVVEGEEALYLYLTIAEVWAGRLGDEGMSAEAYQRALEVSHTLEGQGRATVRNSLRELFWTRGDWRSLAELTEADARQTPAGADRARLFYELGELRMGKLHDIAGAAGAFRRAADEGGRVDNVKRVLQTLVQQHPDSFEAFDVLRAISQANLHGPNDARELIALLAARYQRLDPAHDGGESAELLLQMGELVAEHLDDSDEGLDYFAAAFDAGALPERLIAGLNKLVGSLGPNAGAYRFLRDLHSDAEAWRSALDAGLLEAEHTPNEIDRARIHIELARILRDRLGEPDRACEQYNKAYDLDPERAEEIASALQRIAGPDAAHPTAVAGLRRIYRDQGDDERLLHLLEVEENRERSPERRAALLLDMAELCAGPKGRPDRALEFYEAAAELAGDDVDRIVSGLFDLYSQGYYTERVETTLRAVCLKAGRVEALVQLLTFNLDTVSTREEQAAIHFELGELNERYTEDYEQAMHHYQRAFKLDTARPDYIEAGRDLYRQMGNLDMVARLFDIQLKVVTNPEEAARLLLDKSRVLGQEMGDYPRALEALGRACALAPGLRAAHDALVQLVRSVEGELALNTLEEAYVQAQRPAEAAAIDLMIAEHLRHRLKSDLTPDERDETVMLATTFELKAYRLDPTGNARVRAGDRLEQSLTELERWKDLAEVLQRRATHEPSLAGRFDTLMRLGHLSADKLDDDDLAVDAFGGCLDIAPAERAPFDALEALYLGSNRKDDLRSLYQWALDAAPWALGPQSLERRADLLLRYARLLDDLDDHDEARRAYGWLSELQPNHPTVVAYFEAHGDTEEGAAHLFRILERGLLQLTETADRAHRLARMASLAEDGVNDPLLAIDQYVALIDMVDVAPDLYGHARERLRTLFHRAGRLDELVTLLHDDIDDPHTTPADRLERLETLIQLEERERHQIDAAADALRQLASLSPEPLPHILRLADLYARAGRPDDEAAALEELLDGLRRASIERLATPDAERKSLRRADLELRLADGLLRAGHHDRAAEHFRALLEDDHHRHTALDQLQRILTDLGDHEAVITLLDAQVLKARDTSDKVRFLGRIALLAEQHLHDPQRAIEGWRGVLALRPRDPDGLRHLEDLYDATGSPDRLIETSRVRLLITTDPTDRAAIILRIGEAWSRLDDLDKARRAWLDLIEEQPDHVEAREALYRLYQGRGDHAELVALIDELLRLIPAPARRRELLAEQARVAIAHLDNVAIAVNALEKLTDAFPDDDDSLANLFDLNVRRAHWPRATELLARRIALSTDPGRTTALRLELARILRDELDQPADAADALATLLRDDPDHRDAALQLDPLLEQLERWQALADHRSHLLDRTTDDDERAALLTRLAALLDARLGQPDLAFEPVVDLHHLQPDQTAHLDELYRLAEAGDLWTRLLDVLGDDAANASALEDRLALQLRMAKLVEEHLDAPRQAFAIYGEVFLADPRDPDVLAHLERIADLDPELWTDVIALHDHLIRTLDEDQQGPDVVVPAWWRVAEIQHLKLQRPDQAFETLRYALNLGAASEDTLARLHQLAEDTDQWQPLVVLHDERWRAATDPAVQVDILALNARLIAEKLHDLPLAFDQVVLAAQLDPDHAEVHERLYALAEELGLWDTVAQLLELLIEDRRQKALPDPQRRFLLQLADVHEQHRHDPDAALLVVHRAFLLDTDNADVRDRFEALGQTTARLPDIAGTYLGLAADAQRTDAIPFLLHAARIHKQKLDNPDEAANILRRVLQLDPENDDARTRLELLYTESDDVDALVTFYTQRADRASDPDERFELYTRVANLLVDANDLERAIDYHRRAGRVRPDDLSVLHAVARLHAQLQQHDRQARALEQLADAAQSQANEDTLVHTLFQLADLFVALERLPRAIEVLDRLVELRPVRLDTFDRLADLLRQAARFEELIALHQRRVTRLDEVIDLLDADDEPQDDERHPTLRDASGDLPRSVDLRADQRRLLREMILLALDDLHSPRRALDVLNDIVRRDPEDLEALEQLADIYAGLRLWEEHVTTLRRRLDLTHTPGSDALLLTRIADVLERELNSPDRAADALRDLLRHHPDDGTALADLGRLCALVGRWNETLQHYRHAVDLQSEHALPADLRAELLCRMAELYEGHDQPSKAFDHFEEALQTDPNSIHARRAVIRFLALTDDWQRHVELLQLDANLEPDPRRRAQAHWQIGNVCRDRGHDPDRAFDAYQKALLDAPDLLEALRDLADLAFHHNDLQTAWQAYTELLDGNIPRMNLEAAPLPSHRLRPYETLDDPAHITYTVRLGQVADRLGLQDEAIKRLTAATRTRNNLLALHELGRIAWTQGNHDLANRNLAKLINGFRDTLAPRDRADIHTLMASVALAQNHHPRALDFLELALDDQPDHRNALDLATRTAAHLGRNDEAADTLERLALVTDDEAERYRLLLQLGDFCANTLHDEDRALDAFERARALAPQAPDAAGRVLDHMVRHARWDDANAVSSDLVDTYDRDLQAAPHLLGDPTWRANFVRLLTRRGDILHRAGDDRAAARATFERALELEPLALEPLEALALLLGQDGDLDDVVHRYERFVAAMPAHDLPARARVLSNLGFLLAGPLQAPERALGVFERLTHVLPDDVAIRDALVHIHRLPGHADAAQALHHLRAIIAAGDLSELRLRQLLDIFRADDDNEGAVLLLRILDLARCVDRDEQKELRDRLRQTSEPAADDLAGRAWALWVRPPLARTPLADLMAFIPVHAAAVVYQSLIEHGVHTSELVSADPANPLGRVARDVAALLGVAVDLYVADHYPEEPRLILARPISAAIRQDVFKGLFTKEQRYTLGRVFELARPAYVLTATLGAFDLMTLYEALWERGSHARDQQRSDAGIADRIEAWHDLLDEVLAPEELEHLDDLARRTRDHFAGQPRPTIADWKRAVHTSASRAALFAAGDPLVALKRILREDSAIKTPAIRNMDDFLAALQASKSLRDAIVYLLSDDYHRAIAAIAVRSASAPPDADELAAAAAPIIHPDPARVLDDWLTHVEPIPVPTWDHLQAPAPPPPPIAPPLPLEYDDPGDDLSLDSDGYEAISDAPSEYPADSSIDDAEAEYIFDARELGDDAPDAPSLDPAPSPTHAPDLDALNALPTDPLAFLDDVLPDVSNLHDGDDDDDEAHGALHAADDPDAPAAHTTLPPGAPAPRLLTESGALNALDALDALDEPELIDRSHSSATAEIGQTVPLPVAPATPAPRTAAEAQDPTPYTRSGGYLVPTRTPITYVSTGQPAASKAPGAEAPTPAPRGLSPMMPPRPSTPAPLPPPPPAAPPAPRSDDGDDSHEGEVLDFDDLDAMVVDEDEHSGDRLDFFDDED